MKNTFGSSISVTVFGESHGDCIGAVLDGLPAGIEIDRGFISSQLEKRRPSGKISTSRAERDEFQIVSGCFNGKTCGTPLTIIIPNENTRSRDYDYGRARPGHADYTAAARYGGFADMRGSGQFSGRLTAPLVFAGAVAKQLLARRGIFVGAHICSINGIKDTCLEDSPLFRSGGESLLRAAAHRELPVLDEGAGERMREAIAEAKRNGDSLGGVIECAATLRLASESPAPIRWKASFRATVSRSRE